MKYIQTIAALLLCFMTASLAAGDKGIERLHAEGRKPTDAPYTEAVRAGNTLYLAGKLGIVPGTRKLAPGGIKGETKQAMDNIKAVLTRHGYSMNNLVKCTVMLADIAEWGAFNEVYRTYFEGDAYPARSAFAAGGMALDARVEVECIGYVK